ncbi:TadE/TadG family type IV pilus assembly protein [Phytoactinopolyspora halotolerans]|uniref:Pilus assembly protein n=1 Tax=Phytoactinopolyspora halotolerans TaxID=1981512 RepID=A0A6L9S9D4_9ACTN|nr:TadE/TadG family type IV pilus assembly protein [Phytoactinopolyspora halotolerans]NEE01172.1 pilus assembly protein [Phytoactinopolyspora halotolerans]
MTSAAAQPQPGRRRGRPGHDRGSATVEFAVGAPALLLIVAVLALAGRVTGDANAVEQAAADAARAASLARSPAAAVSAAYETATMALADRGTTCRSTTIDVDTAGFHAPAGEHATVSVTITCPIQVMDLPIPGMTARTATKTAISPIDTYRTR